MRWSLVFDHGLTPLTSLLGLTGNVLSFAVLATRTDYRSKPFGKLLLLLTMADTTFILSILMLSAAKHQLGPHQEELYLLSAGYTLGQTSLTLSMYTTVAICVERFVVVSSPLRAHRPILFSCLLWGTVAFTFLFSLPVFFELTIQWDQDRNAYYLSVSDLRLNPIYTSVYLTVLRPLITLAVPFLSTVTFSLLIVLHLVKSGRRAKERFGPDHDDDGRTRKVTLTLLSVVLLFIICHSFRIFYVVVELLLSEDELNNFWTKAMDTGTDSVSNWLLVLNSASNVVLYAWRDSKFRAALAEMTASDMEAEDRAERTR